ncbi:hypothetical protein BDDG_13320 [Blastomyces dermatitidis ATCC 18188]|uniref:Uncharacterized protein n=1 Tax=Ajellomyces dermatitidis (strain ATCC 18188 / CBS 674.68) TaxID=653446 RepID=A0A0J9ESY4_AJEDA|nr:hypothetical protein BDDG_13320 [Blastomyces dermatitidis ATCC 18188]
MAVYKQRLLDIAISPTLLNFGAHQILFEPIIRMAFHSASSEYQRNFVIAEGETASVTCVVKIMR